MELFKIVPRQLSLFPGSAPKLNHPLCLTFPTFSYDYSSGNVFPPGVGASVWERGRSGAFLVAAFMIIATLQ